MWEPLDIPSFGGGLNFTANPRALNNDEWSGCDGWLARDGYAEVAPGWSSTPLATVSPTVGEFVTGLFPNPFTEDGAVVTTLTPALSPGGVGKLYTVSGLGVVTEITPASTQVQGRLRAIATGAVLNGFLVLCFGCSDGTNFSLLKWNGGATYDIVDGGATALRWDAISGFKSHIVGVYGERGSSTAVTLATRRGIGWSDVDDPTVWLADVDNTANTATLDDLSSGITALLPLGPDALGIFTKDAIHMLGPTGQDPAFIRQEILRGIGCVPLGPASEFAMPLHGLIPGGAIFAGGDDLYTVASGRPDAIGSKIFRYWARDIRPTIPWNLPLPLRPFVWHEDLGVLIVPRPILDPTEQDVLYFHPRTGAWSRQSLPNVGTTAYRCHGFLSGLDIDGNVLRRHWLAGSVAGVSKLYLETPTGANLNRTVDTKDFAFDSPSNDDEVSRIKVEWEPLTNASTDALEVYGVAREHPSKAVLGSQGLDTTVNFGTALGTLTGGASELTVKLKGRYTRFRFKNVSGRCRIRGLSIRRQRAGDKAAA